MALTTAAATAEDMERLGRRLGDALVSAAPEPDAWIVYLKGPLGAGKTTLARGALRAFGIEGIVRSPTYTLVEDYDSPFGRLIHVDLYRIGHPGEIEFLGLDGYRDALAAMFEWPERGQGTLPAPDLEIDIDPGKDPRPVSVRGTSPRGATLARGLGVQETFSKT